MPVFTGLAPDYNAPQMCVTSLAEQAAQEDADAEAAELRKEMTVVLFEDAYVPGRPVVLALDGSGEGTGGSGIYIEHMWGIAQRRFIKQHALIDIATGKAVGMCITMEKPGDAKILPSMVRALAAAGVVVEELYADSAYDTEENWRVCDELGTGFLPNLKKNFKDTSFSENRSETLALQEALGRAVFHQVSGYNERWLVECFFSYTKKLYGQSVRNRIFGRMAVAMRFRYMLYNHHRDCIIRALGTSEA